MHISQNLDFFWPLPVLNFVCCPFPFFFPQPFYSGYLLHRMFSLAALKSWMLIMGEALINHRYSGPFYHRFCNKTDVVFRSAMSECRQYLNLTIVQKGVA